MTFPVLFFGVSTGSGGGHYIFAPGPRYLSTAEERSLPMSLHRLDGVWCYERPRTRDEIRSCTDTEEQQPQGRAFVHDVDGWTVVSWWDRSEDKRSGCCAVFLAPGRHDFARMLDLAREHFPSEIARMERSYPIELAGDDLVTPEARAGTSAAADLFLVLFRALQPAVQTAVAQRIRSEFP